MTDIQPVGQGGKAFVGLVSLAFGLFVVTHMWGPAGPYVAMPFLLAWLLYWTFVQRRVVLNCSLVWLVFVFLIYLFCRVLIAHWSGTHTLADNRDILPEYLRISGLWSLVLAPWFVGRSGQRNLHLLLLFGLIGGVGEALWAFWSQGGLGSPGGRLKVLGGPNATATTFGIFLVLALTVGFAWCKRIADNRSRAEAVAGWGSWLALLGFVLLVMILTESRSAMLSLAALLPFGIGVSGAIAWIFGGGGARKKLLWCAAAGAVILMAVAAANWDRISARYEQVEGPIISIMSGDFSDLGANSVGKRIMLDQFALSQISETPIWGYSPAGVEPLIRSQADEVLRKHSDVHNVHLELLLSLGIAGGILFYTMVVISATEVIRASLHGRLRLDVGLFWLFSVAFIALEGCFDTRIWVYSYGLMMAIMGSIGIACQMERMLQGSVKNGAGRPT